MENNNLTIMVSRSEILDHLNKPRDREFAFGNWPHYINRNHLYYSFSRELSNNIAEYCLDIHATINLIQYLERENKMLIEYNKMLNTELKNYQKDNKPYAKPKR